MAEYQTIEYRIAKDGTVTETVINATGAHCTLATAAIETALGIVEQRELLPEYYEENEEDLTSESVQQSTQG